MKFPDLSGCKLLACDTETRDPCLTTEGPGFVRGLSEVIGISMSWGPAIEDSVYLPIAHEGGGNLDRGQVLSYLQAVFNCGMPTVWANAGYDLEALACAGVNVPGPIYDVQLAEYLIDENRQTYKLDSLAEKYLGERKLSDKLVRAAMEKFGVAEKEAMSHIWRMAAEDVSAYAKLDTNLTYRIHQQQQPLITDEGLEGVYTLERDLIPIVHKMRMQGVRIDESRLDDADKFTARECDSQLQLLEEMSGVAVDIWAAKSVFEAAAKCGLANEVQKTEADNPSFTSPWLMMQEHPFWKALLAARQLDKMHGTFLANVRKFLHNGRVYPQWRQARYDSGGTKTGRFSSANPAFQQIPARNPELAQMARAIILPEEGEIFVAADYSQQEPRLGVHYAALLGLRGSDEAVTRYHADPKMSYHKMVQDLTGLEYRTAKMLNLGLSYGMGVKKFAQNAGVPYTQALEWFKQHHAGVPFVKELANRCQDASERRGYVKTILGRRRRFTLYGPRKWEPGIRPLPQDLAQAEWGYGVVRYFTYRAGNAVIQGSAADMTKQAMVNIYKDCGFIPHLTIHDEMVYSRPMSSWPRDLEAIRYHMSQALPLLVPCPTDAEFGPNLGEMVKTE